MLSGDPDVFRHSVLASVPLHTGVLNMFKLLSLSVGLWILFLGLVILLSGCSSVMAYDPYSVEIKNPVLYGSDTQICRTYASDYNKGISLKKISESTGKGAANNLSGAALNPLVPVLGAIGGGSGETLDELGLTDTSQIHVFVICLRKKTELDGSALVLDPN